MESKDLLPPVPIVESTPASDPALVKILEEIQKQSSVQTAALAQQVADQTAASERQTAASLKSSEELAKALETLGKSSSNIKPMQPHFSPKNTLDDYLKYKDFVKAFEFFIKRVPDWGDRVE